MSSLGRDREMQGEWSDLLDSSRSALDTAGEIAPWKRPFDLIISGILLVVLCPLMACLALLVRADSPGPAFYRQDRIGRHGKHFRIWKFRSMHVNSDPAQHHQLAAAWFAADDSARGYKSQRDPRVTRVGRFLRQTSLDELPQLINVLRGEMSLVGPRPAIPYELAYYIPAYFERQKLLPGITGLWQVHRRDRLSADEMMSLDLKYLRDCSLWLDIQIVALTIPALLADVIRTG
jgi:lipopolysaccharide/colanic/teichoic acid biosynthesis glycosyltransferase